MDFFNAEMVFQKRKYAGKHNVRSKYRTSNIYKKQTKNPTTKKPHKKTDGQRETAVSELGKGRCKMRTAE